MATVFKTFLNDDVVTSRTLLHEAIPITGSLVVSHPEGAYSDPSNPSSNVKTYPHGMFQSVYDYPYASSSANHIFDVTVGIHPESTNYDSANDAWAAKKRNIYNQMAQVLVGHDVNGNILKFDQDGDFASGGVKYEDVFFINIARLIAKDEVRKGSFQMSFGIGQPVSLHDSVGNGNDDNPATKNPDGAGLATTYVTVGDDGAATDYRVNSPAGEYGILKIEKLKYQDGAGGALPATGHYAPGGTNDLLALYTDSLGISPDAIRVGLIYYQAGIVVLDRSLFAIGTEQGGTTTTHFPLDIDPITGLLNPNAAGDAPGVLPFNMGCTTTTGGNVDHDGLYTLGTVSGGGNDGGLHWSYDDRGMVDWFAATGYRAGGTATGTDGAGNTIDWTNVPAANYISAYGDIDRALKFGPIDALSTGLRGRVIDIGFNNTTELNSTIYFCRVNHNDFNYSSNPTYLGDANSDDNSKIRVKTSTLDAPVSYVTTIGLYSADNELLAVAKLSEPLRKDPTNEMTLRVRLDY